MNCLLFHITGKDININGSIINAIEYFLYIYEQDNDFKLVLLDGDGSHVKLFCKMIEQRYVLGGIENCHESIITMSLPELIKTKFDKVLILNAKTIRRIKSIIRAEKIVIVSDRLTYCDKFTLNKKNYNVIYYGEMPFEYYDVKYKMKFLFQRYKPLDYEKDSVYVSTHMEDKEKITSLVGDDDFILRDSTKSVDNFLCEFNKAVYITTPDWVDPSPRLFHECKFYGKEVVYINPDNVRDGGWYRYSDYLDEPIEERYFSKDDLVVREFI